MRAPHLPSPSLAMNPLRAYSRDLEGRAGATELGPADALWLQVALALYRLGELGPDAREAYLRALQMPGSTDPGDPSTSREPAEPSPVEAPDVVRDLARARDEASMRDALSVLRSIVEGMENQHAFHLAFATLSAARAALPDLPPLLTGRLLAQQARVARQLGDLEAGADLYDTVRELGTLHGEPELLVRGHVGAGLIAETRGNFPAAREQYGLALVHAESAPGVAALAHHGLMVAASTAGDLGTALRHAWAAFEGVAGDAVRRVDLLINLAELARKAGNARVALRAFRTALEHTALSRLRLPAISGAANAAAALGDRPVVMSLAELADREAPESGIPYEHAKLWRGLAEAYLTLDDTERAAAYAQRAADIAEAHAFHEQGMKAAALLEDIARRGDRRQLVEDVASRGDRLPIDELARRGRPLLEESDATAHDILRRLDALADAGRIAIVG